jgi:prophage tail gpP-like protein
MSKATPGSQYEVIKDDWLSTIAAEAYGDLRQWPLIADANPQINGRGVAVDGSSLIFPGDILWIPLEEKSEEDDFMSFGKQQEDTFSLEIEGILVPVSEATLLLTMDTGSDNFTAVLDVDFITEKLREHLLPYRYPKCTVRINGVLKLTGSVYIIEPVANDKKRYKKITGYSNTVDVIDSSVNPPYEFNAITLINHAKRMVKDIGISAVFYSGAKEFFDKVTTRTGEKRFSHLVSLAKQRGLLISCTPYGNLLFHRSNDSLVPVETIEEGEVGATSYKAKYDGRKRFKSYRIVGKTFTGEVVTKTITDPFVSKPRYFARNESNVEEGNITVAATWERSKAIADALTMEVPYPSWTTKNGDIWATNTYINLKSKTLDLRDGAILLIRRVLFSFTEKSNTCVLNVVPREVFTNEKLPDIWS